MAKEKYRAEGPDGNVTFWVDPKDGRGLAEIAHEKAGRDDMTFTKIIPLNAAAKAVVPPPL